MYTILNIRLFWLFFLYRPQIVHFSVTRVKQLDQDYLWAHLLTKHFKYLIFPYQLSKSYRCIYTQFYPRFLRNKHLPLCFYFQPWGSDTLRGSVGRDTHLAVTSETPQLACLSLHAYSVCVSAQCGRDVCEWAKKYANSVTGKESWQD